MNRQPVYRMPRWFVYYLAAVVALVLWAGSCATLARLGGAGAGAGLGAAVAGPFGAAGGAIAGDAVANAVMPQPVEPQTVIHAGQGSTVYATPQDEPSWLARYWKWLVGAAVVLRFHKYLIGLVSTLATGGLKAAGLNLAALFVDVGAKAKAATNQHRERRAATNARLAQHE